MKTKLLSPEIYLLSGLFLALLKKIFVQAISHIKAGLG